MKKLSLLVALLCASLTTFAVDEIYDTNFALASNGASATASSGNADLAIDGNEGTRWESAATDDETFTLDMGQLRIFKMVRILWENAYCSQFELSYSTDGTSYTPFYNETALASAGWQTIEATDKITARYIKYHGTKRATAWGQSFWEFQVLLPGVPVLTTIELTASAPLAKVGEGVNLTVQPKDQNGKAMTVDVTYEVNPVDAGTVSGGKYTPAKYGAAEIVAKSGSVTSNSITVAAYDGENVAKGKTTEASGYNTATNEVPANAVDDNEGSLWSATEGETGDTRVYDAWIIVDLGAFYDINLIAIRWEGACSKHYKVEFSSDKTSWLTAYTAGWNAIATHWEYLVGTTEDNTMVRYIRVWSTEAISQYGIKIMDLKVFGTPWVKIDDDEKPVMGTATIDKVSYNSAILNVSATDNTGIKSFHVVEAAKSIDKKYVAADGKINIADLAENTEYNFVISAIDVANNESDNKVNLKVTTPARALVPKTAAPAPTWPAAQVKSIYSDAYTFAPASLNSYNEGWWNNPIMTEETIGEDHYLHYEFNKEGMIGAQFAETSVTNMEKVHLDVYASAAGSVTFRLITAGDPEAVNLTKKTLTLEAEKWNSFDFDLADFGAHNWEKFFQFAIEGYWANGLANEHMSLDNLYLYTTTSTGEQGIELVESFPQVRKVLLNGQLLIINNNIVYTPAGQRVR